VVYEEALDIRAPVLSLLRDVRSPMFPLVPSDMGTVSKPNAKSFQLRAPESIARHLLSIA
jgi:hypothetical protein